MHNYILPIPFALGPYGIHPGTIYKRILDVSGASTNAGDHNPSNVLRNQTVLLDEITFHLHDDDKPEIGHFLASAQSMQEATMQAINHIWPSTQKLAVIGGDHSVAIGTGAGLSQVVDMRKVGLIWIDSHGDCNTPENSQTKSITGYPLAVNLGKGPAELTKNFNGNTIKNVVHIGVRDFDHKESDMVMDSHIHFFNIFEVEKLGIYSTIVTALQLLDHCEYIWVSFDIDTLDSCFFQPGETDVPVPGGLTPREMLTLMHVLSTDPRLKVLEIVQLNDVGHTTPLVIFCSRLLELFFGVGSFRYT
jgi:arginase